MKKMFLVFLCLIASICSAQPSHYGPYDPGAIRSDGTNASDTVTLNRVRTATGTAAAPAYTFSSDPDTGIYSAGANTLAFTLGGAENARISDGGNVLIATSADEGYKLRVNGSALFDNTILTKKALAAHSGQVGSAAIFIQPDATDAYVSIQAQKYAQSYDQALAMQPNGGNVLIATSTDDGANKLQVNGNIKADKILAATGTAAAPAYTFSTDPDTGIFSAGANAIGFGIDGAEKMRIDSTGNFGMGTTAPTLIYSGENKALEIYAEGSNAAGVRLSNDNGTNACMELVLANIDESSIYTKGGPLVLWTNGAERMRIASAGNVLIATSTDDGSNKLQVNGFTKLGEAATGIKMKVLTGTTGVTEGYQTGLNHGISSGVSGGKILAVDVSVATGSAAVLPGFTKEAGFEYDVQFNDSQVLIDLSAANSENILSWGITAVIWYKE